MKILHIENEPDYVYFLKEGLEPFGIEIVNIDSPEDAIAHFANNSGAYDVIICDGQPGILDGDDVVQALRSYNQHVPIVAQSDFPQYIERMFKNGATWSVPRRIKNQEEFHKFQNLLRELTLRFPKK